MQKSDWFKDPGYPFQDAEGNNIRQKNVIGEDKSAAPPRLKKARSNTNAPLSYNEDINPVDSALYYDEAKTPGQRRMEKVPFVLLLNVVFDVREGEMRRGGGEGGSFHARTSGTVVSALC
jgi:hypothetical protein